MLLQILDFKFSILVSLGSIFANEAVFSHIFTNRTKATTVEQQFLTEDFSSRFLSTSFDILNHIEIDNLERIMSAEFAQGLTTELPVGL